MLKQILFAFLFCLGAIALSAQAEENMTNGRMEQLLLEIGDKLEGVRGNWQVLYGEHILFVITDSTHNRMRIFTPITEEEKLKGDERQRMLEANFHAALDAKYALYSGFVVSLFTHPLQELTESQFVDAVRQVAVAARNFGDTYSSTDLIFGGNQTESEADKKVNQKPKKRT